MRPDGTFDLDAAIEDYIKFLQSVPERNRIYLEQALEAAGYWKTSDRYRLTGTSINGTMRITGARITNPTSPQAEDHAERYYGLIRKMNTDVAKIAKNTGYSVEEIQYIKDYLFMDEHDLEENGIRRFFPDFAIAQSWQRLFFGEPEPHDWTLLQHELLERQLMLEGLSQDEAHTIASFKYNYSGEAHAYYDTLSKHKDR